MGKSISALRKAGIGERGGAPARIGSVLAGLFRAGGAVDNGQCPRPRGATSEPTATGEVSDVGRYDFDLAEFPLFRFAKSSGRRHDRDPLVYADSITGRDGSPVAREWRAYPGPFGFGGPSAHALLYDLLQLYAEQGGRGTQIQFGTLRSLLLRRGERNPSKRDYDRLRRDFDVLRGYDFHCTNAFWDRDRRAYVDMKWRLFGSVFYFRPAAGGDTEAPFGFIEVSPVLAEAARRRGFFSLGFGHEFFHRLKPLEQRLAVYLAKKFVSQQTHRKHLDQLARALPVEARRPADVKAAVRSAAEGLLGKGLPCLTGFRFERGREGRPIAAFERKTPPRQGRAGRIAAEVLEPSVALCLELIAEAVGTRDDQVWWTCCVRRLGHGAVDRALGQLKEACRAGAVRNRGGLLTKIFKDIAAEAGVALK